jgi:hypothetical protein
MEDQVGAQLSKILQVQVDLDQRAMQEHNVSAEFSQELGAIKRARARARDGFASIWATIPTTAFTA